MIFDLIGVGIGPFNLSLAALLDKTPDVSHLFLDKKPQFDWHPELMFSDSMMQTNFLTDLVTPVDPTSPHSFLNYLANKDLFYHFINTERNYISRMEFEQYCQWVAEKIKNKLKFNMEIKEVSFANDIFTIQTPKEKFFAKNICIATGLVPKIPKCAEPLIGRNLFYAKSQELSQLDLTHKKVAIIGGGQTGIEVFSNALNAKWGKPKSLCLITVRNNLEAFEESPFTSEYFTPSYLNTFWDLNLNKKSHIVEKQHLLSDGNTPDYLLKVYNDLYQKKYVEHDSREIGILACRELIDIEKNAESFRLTMNNTLYDNKEYIDADIVILCTSLKSVIPRFLEPLYPQIHFDTQGRFIFNKSYAIQWDGPEHNRIYALNFSRHHHGIIDPQINLMAWRSAAVIKDLTHKKIYRTEPTTRNFVDYGKGFI